MSVYGIGGSEVTSAYSVGGESLSNVYDVGGNQISLDGGVEPIERQWLDTAVITALPTISVTGVKQGGCTDGEYIYQCSGDSSNGTYMTIIKYKISDGTYTSVTYNGTPNFGHANDMTYNPNTGYLYICTMLSDGSIIVLNASDLSYVDTVYIVNSSGNPYQVWQICYDRLKNVFYSSASGGVCEYDASWDYVRLIPMATQLSATAQGCETDGVYYYRITYNQNYVDVCKLSTGERVATITNPVSNEPEAIMYDWNGNYYFSGYNTPSLFYRIQLFDEV